MIKEQIEQDIKTAMLAGEKDKVMTLRMLKSAILNVEVAKGSREQGLSDQEVIEVFTKEAKKRQESADLYVQGGNQEKANAEIAEKTIIEQYLPAQMSDEELLETVEQAIAATGVADIQGMGQVIGAVKAKVGVKADGARIAKMVKENLS